MTTMKFNGPRYAKSTRQLSADLRDSNRCAEVQQMLMAMQDQIDALEAKLKELESRLP